MKTNLHLLLATCVAVMLVVVFGLSSCVKSNSDCPPVKTDTTFLTTYHTNVVPYGNKDTLRFKHNSGATYTFVGYGIGYRYDFVIGKGDGCPGNRLYFHHLQWGYKNITVASKPLALELFYNYGYSANTGLLGVTYLNKNYIDIADALYPPGGYPNVIVNNVNYTYVRKILNGFNSWGPDTMYYNKEFGILKIVADNEVLERIP